MSEADKASSEEEYFVLRYVQDGKNERKMSETFYGQSVECSNGSQASREEH